MVQQIATSEPNSVFIVPANHVLPLNIVISDNRKISAKCWHIEVASGRRFKSTKYQFWRQRYSSKGGSRIKWCYCFYSNPSSRPSFVGGAIPSSVSLTALRTIGGPEVVTTVSIALPQMQPTAFTVQGLAQKLVSSRKNHLSQWKMAQRNKRPSEWQSVLASSRVPMTQLHWWTMLNWRTSDSSDCQDKDGDCRVCLTRNYVQWRSKVFRADVWAATGTTECLLGPTQPFLAT